MKKNTLVLFGMLLASLSYSQKIQLKKNVVLKDEIPIGKLEGKATMFNGTNVIIQSSDGTPLIVVKDPLVKFGSAFHEPMRYYLIDFIPYHKTVAFIPADKRFFTSEKKLVEYLFTTIGKDFFNSDGINESMIDSFIAEKDEAKKINDDTLHIARLVKVSKEKLQEPLIPRPANTSVGIRSVGKSVINKIWAETSQTFDIEQGGVIIGTITKYYKGDPSAVSGTIEQSKSVHYIVKRRVNPFTLDGETITYVDLTSVKSSTSGPDVYTDCSTVGLSSFKTSDIYHAELEIVSWLSSKGCL
jgi:hypothetical protein